MICHLAQSKESLEKVRKDFTDNLAKPALDEDPSLANTPKSDLLNKLLTIDSVQELEFTGMVVHETLRFRNTIPFSHYYTPTKDIQLGKYTF